MNIRIAGTVNDSFVDGPGIRYAVFVQGCSHHCSGCHNPGTHDPKGGQVVSIDDLMAVMMKNKLLDGLTLSGGDPMEQPVPCAELAKQAHDIGLSVWCYTGYTWEELLKENDPDKMLLLQNVDVLVDGPFVQAQRTLELPFRGSRNQRLIIVPASLRLGRVVEFMKEENS